MYCCVIFCRRKKFLRKIILNVKARPSLLHISSLPQIPEVGKVLVLCCRVEKFYPEDIKVEWYKQNGEMVQKFTQFGPFSDHERLYSLWSTTELTVTTVDDGTVCTCRLYHSSFPAPQYKDVTYHINTQGVSPSVMFIKCDPLQPEEGKECTINLCVKDFCPDRVTVTWFRDGETVSAGVFNSPTSLNINGLYSMWTFLKLTPRKHDLNAVFSLPPSLPHPYPIPPPFPTPSLPHPSPIPPPFPPPSLPPSLPHPYPSPSLE
ncbi:uncharacterized protein LOC115815282 [Chanos chanos]|uniref:Uncharacterized protein LOC115815282 n=1 Tax=Chanos chanos TaxID=29144 RepID=A0A6J2VMA7_CHACN|nr:uncharacterized protein LOC115815282 [Chanos chanos]